MTERIALGVGLAMLVCPGFCAAQPIAFPGAVGQGAVATGGRGGDVYHVTNLDDYVPKVEQKIPGSLRHAIRSATGPRTIVFDVSGAIPLACPLEILKDDLTIAGQTSPAGITLWGYPVEISKCSNVIVRFLRVRTGDFHAMGQNGRPERGNGDLRGDDSNSLTVGNGASRILLDHLSVSWSMDETLSVTDANDVTVQHCLIAESLDDSYHSKGPHGYGSLIRGNLTAEQQAEGVGGYTFYGNLWAHHRARNPSIAGQQRLAKGQTEADRGATDVNLINNVVYNWGDRPTHRSTSGRIRVNLIGNYYVNGSADDADYIFNEDNPGETLLFHRDNFHDSDGDATHNGHRTDGRDHEIVGFETSEDILLGDGERPYSFVHYVESTVRPGNEAYQSVLQSVGASLHRDVVDERIVDSVVHRTGALIGSQESFRDGSGRLAGIDDLPTLRRSSDFDVDRDGIADEFEREHHLDPSDPKDGQGYELSDEGLTNLEVYLNSLAAGAESSPMEN